MDITKFINYLITEKRNSEHTVLAYKNDLEQFGAYLSEVYEIQDAKEVSFPIVRSYVVELMEKDYHPKSVNRKISSIKSFYKYLRKIGEVEINPASRLQAVKGPKRLVKTVSDTEISELLNEDLFTEDLKGIRAKAIIELLYATGIRRSELISLKFSDVDFDNCTIKVLGKRNKTRIIPFPESLSKVLQKYLALQPRTDSKSLTFFLTEKGKMMYPKLVYDVVNSYLGLVTTIDKKSPHILRHTYATHLLNKGADVNDIKELLGHASLSATQVYTHNSFEKLKKEYNQTHPREHKNR